jgi:Carboxypeptidase activation peptide
MVLPSKLEHVLGRLNDRNIKSKVMINDLQQLIDNENPANLTKQTQDYNFRAGKYNRQNTFKKISSEKTLH